MWAVRPHSHESRKQPVTKHCLCIGSLFPHQKCKNFDNQPCCTFHLQYPHDSTKCLLLNGGKLHNHKFVSGIPVTPAAAPVKPSVLVRELFGQVKTVCNPKAIHWAGELWPLVLRGLILTSLQAPPKPEGRSGFHLWVSEQFHFSCHCLCCYTLSCALWRQHCQQRVWFFFPMSISTLRKGGNSPGLSCIFLSTLGNVITVSLALHFVTNCFLILLLNKNM